MQRAREEKEIMNFTFCRILTGAMKLAEIKTYHKKARNVFTFEYHLLDCYSMLKVDYFIMVDSIKATRGLNDMNRNKCRRAFGC